LITSTRRTELWFSEDPNDSELYLLKAKIYPPKALSVAGNLLVCCLMNKVLN
jgi:hypothetical protein